MTKASSHQSHLISSKPSAKYDNKTELCIYKFALSKNDSVLILEIHVIREKEKIQPKDKVKISIPNPNADILDYVIFHIKSDNSVEEIIPTVADGILSFEASSFSRFIIARKAKCVHDWGEFRMIERATCTSKGKT